MDVDGLTAAKPARINRLWTTLAIAFPVAIFVAGFVWFMRTYVVPPEFLTDAHAIQWPGDIAAQPAPAPRLQETTGTSQPIAVPAPPRAEPQLAPPTETASLFPPPVLGEPPAAAGTASPFPALSIPATNPFASAPAAPEESSTRSATLLDPMTPQRVSELAAEPPADAQEPIAGPVPLPPRRPRLSSAVVRGPVPLPRARPVN